MSTKKLQILGSFGSTDADTLDGKHADEFATVENLDNYALQSDFESLETEVTQKSQVQIITWEEGD